MTRNLGATEGSTIISSISMLALPALINRLGEPRPDRAEGGEDSIDVGDEPECCISTSFSPPAIAKQKPAGETLKCVAQNLLVL